MVRISPVRSRCLVVSTARVLNYPATDAVEHYDWMYVGKRSLCAAGDPNWCVGSGVVADRHPIVAVNRRCMSIIAFLGISTNVPPIFL